MSPPRIYVASLSDYNAGRLHGRWIDADLNADVLHEAVAEMLADSPEPNAEEWAIHDFDNFGPLRIDEFESLERVSEIARGIVRHGDAFIAWVDSGEVDTADLDNFEDRYQGCWESLTDYAAELLEDLGIDCGALVPDWLAPYVTVDVEALGRDLTADRLIEERDGHVYVFDP